MKKQLVLGSGISALAYLFYNCDAFAIIGKTEGVGGLAAIQEKIGPHLLWVDERTWQLLEKLNLPTDRRVVQVGYLKEDRVISGSDMSETEFQTFRNFYSDKTRGTQARNSHMSGGAKEFKVFKISMHEVVRELLARVQFRLIPGEARYLDLYHKVVTIDHPILHEYFSIEREFDELISTIPAPTFLKITRMEHLLPKLESRDKVYRCVPYGQLPPWAAKAKDTFEYAYAADSINPFHRVRFMPEYAVLEYTIPSLKDIHFNDTCEMVPHPKGQIVRGAEIFESLPSYVQLLGRYACWRHDVKLNQVLEKIHGK
jgi:hypothetical protein